MVTRSVAKFAANCAGTGLLGLPPNNDSVFAIAHYAGTVTYAAAEFLEKNRDRSAFRQHSWGPMISCWP